MRTKANTALKKERFIKAFESSLGNVTAACKKAEINRSTYYRWCEKDKDFAMKAGDIEEGIIDFGETCLKKQMKDGNTLATIFFLKCKGKKRGYIEKQEVEHSGAITHNPSNQVETKDGITTVTTENGTFYYKKDEDGNSVPISEADFKDSIGFIDS